VNAQTVDHVALAPLYAAVAAAVLVLLADLLAPPGRREWLLGVAGLGVIVTGAVAWWAGNGATMSWAGTGVARATFCVEPTSVGPSGDLVAGCSFVADRSTAVLGLAFCVLTLAVLALSAPVVRARAVPAGEYTFLLLCSLFGGLALTGSRDLITLLVSLETLSLPLYILVGLRRTAAGASAAVTYLLTSVVSTSVTLLGAALLYAVTGEVHLRRLAAALSTVDLGPATPLAAAGVALVLVGLVFKVAAVPFHAWAGGVYDGSPLPVAAYLSTASKLGGVVALALVAVNGLMEGSAIWASVIAVLAALTMTVGNLLALRQTRTVRLLAWSSVAQAGYVIAPLAGFAAVGSGGGDVTDVAGPLAATLAYAGFYVLVEIGAFAAVITLRGAADGGTLAELRGLARRRPWVAAALALALAGLAGLPPGFAGLFAKVVVVRSLVDSDVLWLALVVAANAVLGLAYYVRVGAMLYDRSEPEAAAEPERAPVTAAAPRPAGGTDKAAMVDPAHEPERAGAGALLTAERPEPAPAVEPATGRSWAVSATLLLATVAAVVLGFLPQIVLWAADAAAQLLLP
jgi:NADH-quinone oxidoreductase subunit N